MKNYSWGILPVAHIVAGLIKATRTALFTGSAVLYAMSDEPNGVPMGINIIDAD